jgi:ribA/ribD-fused uncharacterized protein
MKNFFKSAAIKVSAIAAAAFLVASTPAVALICNFRSGEFDMLYTFYSASIPDFDEKKDGSENILSYPSVEHAFQAAKTDDVEIRKTFMNISAAQARSAGTNINPKRNNWENLKFQIMYKLNWQKFSSNTALKSKLLNTGEHIIIDGHNTQPNDTVWGVAFQKTTDYPDGVWTGENNLGLILMQIRSELRSGKTEPGTYTANNKVYKYSSLPFSEAQPYGGEEYKPTELSGSGGTSSEKQNPVTGIFDGLFVLQVIIFFASIAAFMLLRTFYKKYKLFSNHDCRL